MEEATPKIRVDDIRLTDPAEGQGGAPAAALADEPGEDRGPIPFGESGAAFLRNLLQHAVFLGFVMVILMLMRILGNR